MRVPGNLETLAMGFVAVHYVKLTTARLELIAVKEDRRRAVIHSALHAENEPMVGLPCWRRLEARCMY